MAIGQGRTEVTRLLSAQSTQTPPPLPNRLITTADFDVEPLDVGTAGASARKEHQRRQQRREQQIEEKWGTGFFGHVAKTLSDDPQSTTAWKTGAEGEERLAAMLSQRLGSSAVLLHDRRVPRTRGNIDHIAIAASGVWVIDAKKYKGKVERRDKGSFFKNDYRLYVNGRDQSKRVEGMAWQRDAVVAALQDTVNVPVRCALTFVNAEWPIIFKKPHKFGDVTVCWPRKLADLIAEPGLLSPDDVQPIARVLAKRLPAVR